MALYKRGNTWWMNFWFNNEHVQKSTKCKNKRDAEVVERAYYTQLAKGEVGIEPKKSIPRFRDAVESFLAWSRVEHAAKPNTFLRYQTSAKVLLNYFGNPTVDKITPAEIKKFKSWRSEQAVQTKGRKSLRAKLSKKNQQKKTIAPATVNRELACLKKMFSCLVDDGILLTNPVSKVEFFEEDNQQMRVLSYAEERSYLMACSQPLRDFALIMVETGMRPDEVRRLRVRDINLLPQYVQVVSGKTKAARRRIPLTAIALDVLRDRIKHSGNDLIFAGMRGEENVDKPLVKLNNAHYGALQRSGVEKFRLSDLRHTFATRQVEAGTDLVTLAALLGHAKLDMVMRYAHPSDGHKMEAIRRMAEARNGVKEMVA
jgi:integrase